MGKREKGEKGEKGKRILMTEEPNQMDVDRTCAANNRALGLWARLKLFAGRPRRLYYNWFRKGFVDASMARRRGECKRCGACCQMGNRCRFLFYENGLACCKIYDGRKSPNCQRFPMMEQDIADRDVILPEQGCGFTFENSREGNDERNV